MADAQEQIIRSPYPDLLLEMAVIRMATLAPVIDADELLRAMGAGGRRAARRAAAPLPARSGSGTRAAARVPDPETAPSAGAPPPAGRGRGQGRRAAARRRRAGLDLAFGRAAVRELPDAARAAGPSQLRRCTARPIAQPPDLPELARIIRSRRAALFGFMEQGASLALDGDVLRVIPRNDIYIRYLNDNRGVDRRAGERALRTQAASRSVAERCGAGGHGTAPTDARP